MSSPTHPQDERATIRAELLAGIKWKRGVDPLLIADFESAIEQVAGAYYLPSLCQL